jgi:hypothetical protein
MVKGQPPAWTVYGVLESQNLPATFGYNLDAYDMEFS